MLLPSCFVFAVFAVAGAARNAHQAPVTPAINPIKARVTAGAGSRAARFRVVLRCRN
jgi:hypothetical protein